jgi:hypothetical protein
VVPWAALVQIVEPHRPRSKTGCPPMPVETMLRIHYLQQWFGLSDSAMEEALRDVPPYREFAKCDGAMARLPDETTILRFRHLLECHNLAVSDRHKPAIRESTYSGQLRLAAAIARVGIYRPAQSRHKPATV